jgi:hypothetical protein
MFKVKPCQPRITLHANRRAAQRGVPLRHVDLVYRFASKERCVGSGAREIRLSEFDCRELIETGVTGKQVRQLSRISLVLASDTDSVKTVLLDYGRSHERRRVTARVSGERCRPRRSGR